MGTPQCMKGEELYVRIRDNLKKQLRKRPHFSRAVRVVIVCNNVLSWQ